MSVAPRIFALAVVYLALAACQSTPAPIEDRSAGAGRQAGTSKDGVYRVRTGDTLYSIAFNYGLDWKDVADWNGVRRPYTIYPGQELKLTATPSSGRSTTEITTRAAGKAPRAATRPASTSPAVEPRPVPTQPAGSATTPQSAPPSPPLSRPPVASAPTPAATPPSSPAPTISSSQTPPPKGPLKDPDSWVWPTNGQVLSRFSAGDPSRKGIDIGGQEGQQVVASAMGDVVYSGNGLIGFGELIIIKHSESMLTAYAHNSRRLVQEGERVAAGSKIAEMGKDDQEKTMLHFELRVNGVPVDPLRYLPSR